MPSSAWARHVAKLQERWLGNCVNYAMSALSIYEFLIALDLEVSTAWKRRKTVPAVLLLTIRWVMLVNAVSTFVPTPSYTVCMASVFLAATCNLVGFAQAALFSALRVYALADWSVFLSAAVLVLNLVPLGTNAYRDSHYTCEPSGGTYSAVVHVHKRHIICTLIAADVIVLVVTWKKTFHQWRSSNRLDVNLPVTTCLMRDGTAYFLILLSMNVIDFMGVLAWEIPGLSPMVVYIPPILISRFLLNLRDCANGSAAGTTLLPLGPGVAAQSMLGNIGASLGSLRDDECSYVTDSDEKDGNLGEDDLLADAGGVKEDPPLAVPQDLPASIHEAQA